MVYTKVNKGTSTYTKINEDIEMTWNRLGDATWLSIADKSWKDWILSYIGLTSIYTKISKFISTYNKVKH